MAQDSFFQRWSRRKSSPGGNAPDKPPTPAAARPPGAPPADGSLRPAAAPHSHTGPSPRALAPELDVPLAADPQPSPAQSEHRPQPTMADTQGLTPASDFRPFMGQGVAPEVKNAAMKKLFADPHFNVMDRMDIYIDDYSQPDPLPLAMLRQMNGAKFLNLFEDEDQGPDTPELTAPLAPDALPPAASPAQGRMSESASAHTPPLNEPSTATPSGSAPVPDAWPASPPPSADTTWPADALPGPKT